MDDTLISLFIDDELALPEKISFVKSVRSDPHFAEEAISLLAQEQLLQRVPHVHEINVPTIVPKPGWVGRLANILSHWWQPAAGFATALLLMMLIAPFRPQPRETGLPEQYRFVLYLPDGSQPCIVGTFTDWQPVTMQQTGKSGYWSVNLQVPAGEHRYSYLIENGVRMADPSIATREHDDFGGENSVIVVGERYAPIS